MGGAGRGGGEGRGAASAAAVGPLRGGARRRAAAGRHRAQAAGPAAEAGGRARTSRNDSTASTAVLTPRLVRDSASGGAPSPPCRLCAKRPRIADQPQRGARRGAAEDEGAREAEGRLRARAGAGARGAGSARARRAGSARARRGLGARRAGGRARPPPSAARPAAPPPCPRPRSAPPPPRALASVRRLIFCCRLSPPLASVSMSSHSRVSRSSRRSASCAAAARGAGGGLGARPPGQGARPPRRASGARALRARAARRRPRRGPPMHLQRHRQLQLVVVDGGEDRGRRGGPLLALGVGAARVVQRRDRLLLAGSQLHGGLEQAQRLRVVLALVEGGEPLLHRLLC